MFDSLLVIIVAGLIGPGAGLLLVWIPLADVLTVPASGEVDHGAATDHAG
jgi:hypothetical protein